MQYNSDNQQPLAADEVSIKNIVVRIGNLRRYLQSRWLIILIAAVVGGAIGIAYALHKKPVYTAECTFVLEEGQSGGGGLGQYSAIASMMGVDLGGSGGGLFQSDNIIQLYQSRLMIEKTLLSQANFNGKPDLLINRFIQMNNLRKQWAAKPRLKNINFDIPKTSFTLEHDSIIGIVVNDINKNYLTVEKPDKKLSIISVKVKATDELFAKAFTESIVKNVNDFYVQTKTKVSMQTLTLLQRQADSLRRSLNSSLANTAAAADYNPNPNPALQVLRVPAQRRQIDVQQSASIYAEVVKNLEIARGSLQRETPLIQIIDRPILPLDVTRTGKLIALVTGLVIGAMVCITWLIVQKMYKSLVS